MERIHIIKMLILPKRIYQFNSIQINILAELFMFFDTLESRTHPEEEIRRTKNCFEKAGLCHTISKHTLKMQHGNYAITLQSQENRSTEQKGISKIVPFIYGIN